jgi:uncharacterized membrane protein
MSVEQRVRPRTVLAVVLSVVFALLVHASLVEGLPPTLGALLSLVPLAACALWIAGRTRHRLILFAIFALAAAAIVFEWNALERHFPDLFFVEHASINLLLAFVFGRTLAAGHEPLVSRFARIVHGTIPPEVERYTRHVTLAWTLFFLAIFTASCVLYLGGWLTAWSVLANFLSPILLGAMFAIEYLVRLRALPHWERVGILGGIRAFTRHFGTARFEPR